VTNKLKSIQIFSGYKLTQTLGKGAMGTVYKGVHVTTGQEVAVKCISSGSFSKSEYELLKKRLTDEATAVKNLDSPWIVKVVTVGEAKETGLHLILELIDGPSLADQLSEGKRWIKQEFIEELVRPLLIGLSNLHESGVLHRDIKPANLLKSTNGAYKIADFGLAMFEGRQAKTKTGIIIGTPGYMAPECINNGAKGTTELSDIYSAGVTLYEAITGKSPFSGKSIIETINRQMTLNLTSKVLMSGEHNNCNVNKGVADLIISSMAVDPRVRPQSARAFFDILSREMTRTRKRSTSNLTISSSLNVTIESSTSVPAKKKDNSSGKSILSGKRHTHSRRTKVILISCLTVVLLLLLIPFKTNHRTTSGIAGDVLIDERKDFTISISRI